MRSDVVRPTAISNATVENHLYSTDLADGSRSDIVEDHLAKIEDKAAPVMLDLLAGGIPSGQERANIASSWR